MITSVTGIVTAALILHHVLLDQMSSVTLSQATPMLQARTTLIDQRITSWSPVFIHVDATLTELN